MTASRRDLINSLGAGAAGLPTAEDATNALAQGTVSSSSGAGKSAGERVSEQSETEAWLAQFYSAWRPLDRQLRAVLRMVYAQLKGLPPPAQLPPEELRRINTELAFYFNAGAPALPHIEERTINVPSGPTRVRLYDPGTAAPAPYSLDLETPSRRAYGGGEYFLGTADMDRYLNDYLQDQAARKNPLAVPMLANLTNLPPLYITACEFDPLLDDSERLAARAKSAGVDLEFRLWNGMVHGAVSLMGWIDAMDAEVDRIGDFLRRVTRIGR